MKKSCLFLSLLLILSGCAKSRSSTKMTIKITRQKNPVIRMSVPGDQLSLQVSTFQHQKWKIQTYAFPVKNHQCALTLRLKQGVLVYQSDVLYRSRQFKRMNQKKIRYLTNGTYPASAWQHVIGMTDTDERIDLKQGMKYFLKNGSYIVFSVKS